MDTVSLKNHVFISEYEAPHDWTTVLEIPFKTSLRNSEGKRINRIEKLFYKGPK